MGRLGRSRPAGWALAVILAAPLQVLPVAAEPRDSPAPATVQDATAGQESGQGGYPARGEEALRTLSNLLDALDASRRGDQEREATDRETLRRCYRARLAGGKAPADGHARREMELGAVACVLELVMPNVPHLLPAEQAPFRDCTARAVVDALPDGIEAAWRRDPKAVSSVVLRAELACMLGPGTPASKLVDEPTRASIIGCTADRAAVEFPDGFGAAIRRDAERAVDAVDRITLACFLPDGMRVGPMDDSQSATYLGCVRRQVAGFSPDGLLRAMRRDLAAVEDQLDRSSWECLFGQRVLVVPGLDEKGRERFGWCMTRVGPRVGGRTLARAMMEDLRVATRITRRKVFVCRAIATRPASTAPEWDDASREAVLELGVVMSGERLRPFLACAVPGLAGGYASPLDWVLERLDVLGGQATTADTTRFTSALEPCRKYLPDAKRGSPDAAERKPGGATPADTTPAP